LRILEQNLPGRKGQAPMGSAILLLLPLGLVRQQRCQFCDQLHPSCRRQHDLDLFPVLPALTVGSSDPYKGQPSPAAPFCLSSVHISFNFFSSLALAPLRLCFGFLTNSPLLVTIP